MPTTIAVVFTLCGSMLLGVIVFFTGAVQVVVARRREAAVRAPLIASGIGFVVVLAAAITLGTVGVLHMTYTVEFSAVH